VIFSFGGDVDDFHGIAFLTTIYIEISFKRSELTKIELYSINHSNYLSKSKFGWSKAFTLKGYN
jgi:hypothetical protein